MRPLIGVTAPRSEETGHTEKTNQIYDFVQRTYSAQIYLAGGMPVLIPSVADAGEDYVQDLLSRLDGLYFTGGGKLPDPGAKPLPLFEQQPERSAWEAKLIRAAFVRDLPALGVCRGHQMIASVLGGSLDSQRYPAHKQTLPYDVGIHVIHIVPGTRFAQIVGEEDWLVNSIHVQRVEQVPPGFRAAAFTDDGTIEAIYAEEKKFFLSTQFHPELMPQSERAQKVLRAFVQAAAEK